MSKTDWREVVDSLDQQERFAGWVHVLGPPGTGKTTTLMGILDELLDRGVNPQRIAFISFSRAAIKEATSRVMRQFEGRIKEDDLGWFRTIHATCRRLLRLGYDKRGTIVNLSNGSKLWLDHCKEFGIFPPEEEDNDSEGEMEHNFAESEAKGPTGILSRFVSLARNVKPLASDYMDLAEEFDSSPEDIPPDVINEATKGWVAKLEDLDRFDFTRTLEACLIQDRCHVEPPVDIVILDEAQDTSPLQMQVVRMWAAKAKLGFVAYDKDQAIYEFQGANPSLVDQLAPCIYQIPLLHSHRCAPAIAKIAKQIISPNAVRTGVDWVAVRDLPKGIVESLSEIPYDDVVVKANRGETVLLLARNVYLLKGIVNTLVANEIPFHNLRGKTGLPPQNQSVKIVLDLHLGAKLDKKEMRTFILKLSAFAFKEGGKRGGRNKAWFEKNTDKSKGGSLNNVPGNVEEMVTVAGIKENIAAQFRDFFSAMEFITEQGIVKRWTSDYLVTLATKHGVKFLTEMPKLAIGTIHSVKGGEADHVYVLTEMSRRTYQGYMDNPDSERRVFYVAATRAKGYLAFIGGGYKKAFTEIYDWL